MSDVAIQIRCQRCGTQMDLRDPGPGAPWAPEQFWTCPRCGRHFWTTYPPPTPPKPAGAAAPKPAPAAASAGPAAGAPAAATPGTTGVRPAPAARESAEQGG